MKSGAKKTGNKIEDAGEDAKDKVDWKNNNDNFHFNYFFVLFYLGFSEQSVYINIKITPAIDIVRDTSTCNIIIIAE